MTRPSAGPTPCLLSLIALTLSLTATSAAAQVLGGLAVAPDGSIYLVKNYPEDIVYRVDTGTSAATMATPPPSPTSSTARDTRPRSPS